MECYINGNESEVAVESTSWDAWYILGVWFIFRINFLQVLVGGITHDISKCSIVEVYLFSLTDFSIDVDMFGGLGRPDDTIRSITKVHNSLPIWAYKNYGIIFVHQCLYLITVSFLTVMLYIWHNIYV